MALSRALGLAVGAACATAASTSTKTTHVYHVIVVMMENRSFDHLLGHLGVTDSRIDGLTGDRSNPENPLVPGSPRVPVNYGAVDGGPVDPNHDFDSIAVQVFGFDKPMGDKTSPVKMDGFVVNAVAGATNFVMSAFNSTTLPVLSTLATEFAVFDHWHCSCPCPTNPNREFLMSGTSHGMITNTIPDAGFPQQTHFTFLEERNISWAIYYNDDPWMAPTFQDLRTPSSLAKVQEMPAFFAALEAGTLPQYVLIEPRMAASATGPSNWQHPDNSVEAGEIFYSEIYAALRNSSIWEESLLIITYDEHGGFYDHQATPVGVPAPDAVPGANGFDYSRLGVRIPTVMVSPWIARNTVVNAPSGAQAPTPTSQFEATSIISSVNKIFGIADNMTARDAWAGHFDGLVAEGAVLRSDCPMEMPSVAPLSAARLAAEKELALNDHHLDSLNLLCALAHDAHAVCAGAAPAAQAGLMAQLGAKRAAAAGAWAESERFPHLHAPAACLLQQQDFEGISKALYKVYRAEVMASV